MWQKSPQAQDILKDIAKINARSSNHTSEREDDSGSTGALATSYWVQTMELVRRNWRAQWRCEP